MVFAAFYSFFSVKICDVVFALRQSPIDTHAKKDGRGNGCDGDKTGPRRSATTTRVGLYIDKLSVRDVRGETGVSALRGRTELGSLLLHICSPILLFQNSILEASAPPGVQSPSPFARETTLIRDDSRFSFFHR